MSEKCLKVIAQQPKCASHVPARKVLLYTNHVKLPPVVSACCKLPPGCPLFLLEAGGESISMYAINSLGTMPTKEYANLIAGSF